MHDLDLSHSRQILSDAEQWADAFVKAESLLEIELVKECVASSTKYLFIFAAFSNISILIVVLHVKVSWFQNEFFESQIFQKTNAKIW